MWHVDAGAADSGDGSIEQPFRTIGDALGEINSGEEGTIVVHANREMEAHRESMEINGERAVAIVGLGLWPIQIGPLDGGGPLIKIDGKSTFGYVDGVLLRQDDERGFLLDNGAHGVLDRSQVVVVDRHGVHAANGSNLYVRNTMVWANGHGNDRSSIQIDDSSAEISYGTVINTNMVGMGNMDVGCGSPTGVVVRNSILISFGDGAGCDGRYYDVINSASRHQYEGGDNKRIGLKVSEIHDLFLNYIYLTDGIDLHLSEEGESFFEDVAVRTEEDLPFDIDRAQRPLVGADDYAGADRP